MTEPGGRIIDGTNKKQNMETLGTTKDKKQSEINELADSCQQLEPSVAEQVKREFEYSEDHGEPESEQVENELSEQKYMVPSAENSLEDAAFTNINVEQKGLAYGIANQRNEPLDMTEKREKRDEDRWELDPASAESTDASADQPAGKNYE